MQPWVDVVRLRFEGRRAVGTRTGGRHPEMRRAAQGTDAQNASNHMDLLRAAGQACDLYAKIHDARAALPAARALECLTPGGTQALGIAGRIGSLEVGKRADVASVTQPVYKVANGLVHGSTRSFTRLSTAITC